MFVLEAFWVLGQSTTLVLILRVRRKEGSFSRLQNSGAQLEHPVTALLGSLICWVEDCIVLAGRKGHD